MFNNASHLVFNEPTFIETATTVNNGESGLQYLYRHVARGASHDSKDQYEKPKCHPDTRKQLLSDIQEWIKVPDKETGIMYLHGPAGSGKSCIARSACQEAAKEGLLGASFFFWRDSSSRNNESRLITTLAYQLAEGNDELGQHILSEVARNPRIVEMPLEVQFRKLIYEPCSKVPRERLLAKAIVIDGLDECLGETSQIGILQILARAVRYEDFPMGFFVTSRPELHLQEVLDSKEITFATTIVSLNHIPGVSQDIRTVLESGFNRILNTPRFKRAFKSVSRPWPTAESIERIVRDSSGQFIYAETVLKFVSDPDNNPISQLDLIVRIQEIGSTPSEYPLANLDRLYHQIMSSVRRPELTARVLSYVIAIKDLSRRKIITNESRRSFSHGITRLVLYNQNRLLLVIEQLLRLSTGMAYQSLNQLHSLISLKVGSESKRRHLEIDFYHKSFQDFLTTKRRSRTYYMSLERTHYDIAESCLRYISHPCYETEDQHVGWVYSGLMWYIHANLSGKRKVDIWKFNLELRRFFFQVQSHIKLSKLNEALGTLGILQTPPSNAANWEDVFTLQSDGTYSWEFVGRTVDDISYSIKLKGDRDEFDKSFTHPLLRKLLHSYNNDVQVKKLLIIHSALPPSFPDSDLGKVMHTSGLISDDFSVSQYMEFVKKLRCFSTLHPNSDYVQDFFENAEFSGSFHCTPEDFSNVYAAIIFPARVWRDHLENFCLRWTWDRALNFAATGPLLECLKSEAFEFRDNIELNKKLDRHIELYLFNFLRKKLQGPTEDAISAWELAFVKARSLYPNKFEPWT